MLRELKTALFNRAKNGKQCGFHIANSVPLEIHLSMFFSKLFDRKLKRSIDKKYDLFNQIDFAY